MRISIFGDGEQIASSFSRFKFVEGPWYCSEWILEKKTGGRENTLEHACIQ
jgi:hypothetical protein